MTFRQLYESFDRDKDGKTFGERVAMDTYLFIATGQKDDFPDSHMHVSGIAQPVREARFGQAEAFLKRLARHICATYSFERRESAARIALAVCSLLGLDAQMSQPIAKEFSMERFLETEVSEEYGIGVYSGDEFLYCVQVKVKIMKRLMNECIKEELMASVA